MNFSTPICGALPPCYSWHSQHFPPSRQQADSVSQPASVCHRHVTCHDAPKIRTSRIARDWKRQEIEEHGTFKCRGSGRQLERFLGRWQAVIPGQRCSGRLIYSTRARWGQAQSSRPRQRRQISGPMRNPTTGAQSLGWHYSAGSSAHHGLSHSARRPRGFRMS